MKKLLVVFLLLPLFSCAKTYWNNYDAGLNTEGQFSQDSAYCRMYANGNVQQQQAIQAQTTNYGTTRTSAALASTGNAATNVAVSISSYENCMMSKGWYKNQPPATSTETASSSGAASGEFHKIAETDNNIKKFFVGVTCETNSNGDFAVKQLVPIGPAQKAGVQTGDVVVSVDGKQINTGVGFRNLMDNKQEGDHVFLKIKRNNQIVDFDLVPVLSPVLPDADAIYKILRENRKVALAIVVSQVKNSMPNNVQSLLEQWEAGMRSQLQNEAENFFITAKNRENIKNLSIIDRGRLELILSDFSFGQTGVVSDGLLAQIAETGATHLIVIDFTRFPDGVRGNYSDISNRRVIDIKTGEVLAIATHSVKMGR